MQDCAASKIAGLYRHALEARVTTPPSFPSTSDDGSLARPAVAERIAEAARRMVLLEELEDVMTIAAAAIGDAMGGDAALRVTTDQHDLYATASGVVPPTALPPEARTALVEGTGEGVLLESTAELARCRGWVVPDGRVEPLEAAPLVGELLLHSLVQAVQRTLIVGRSRRNEANLERALDSHRLIGQAMGILIERHRIVSQEAFDLLRRASQDNNVKLREVAERVIETGAEPGDVV